MIFVVGAEGLLGAALLDQLRQAGAASAGSSRKPGSPLVHLELASVRDCVLPSPIGTAVLCAWHGGVAEAAEDPAGTRAINVEGNLALIQHLRQAGANIVFLSTSLVFSQGPAEPGFPLSPCCEYARQKAEVEQFLDPAKDAIVRITKVGETVLPRLRFWAEELRAERPIQASESLRLAPVMIAATVAGLGWLAENFQPGVFQMSGPRDASYFEVARQLAERLAVPPLLVSPDPLAGTKLFHPMPASGALVAAAPRACPEWLGEENALQLLVERAIS